MAKKLNTHQLLIEYHDHPDYRIIAPFAAGLAKQGKNKEQILTIIKKDFGDTELLPTMATKSRPLTIFGEIGNQIPHNALDQMHTALRIPPATRGALMPDAHYGYSVPIGAVVELENAISPAFIGYDISCMVMLTVLEIPVDKFYGDIKNIAKILRKETAFGLGSEFEKPRNHPVMEDSRWDDTNILKQLKSKAHKQLGSSGGGNHFADIVTGTALKDVAWFPVKKDKQFVALMTHSGSRGAGHKIATHYVKLAEKETKFKARKIPRNYGWLEMDTDAGREYWSAMHLMGDYAYANHELIHHYFSNSIGANQVVQYWNRHNFAWHGSLSGTTILHRKGATPAVSGQPGIIPGTSGTPSYFVQGLGNAESLYSSGHGAGRPFSRTEAKKRHDPTLFKNQMEDILHFGIAPDEGFEAYKDIEDVLSIQDGILLERIARLDPRVVIMGGKSDDGD